MRTPSPKGYLGLVLYFMFMWSQAFGEQLSCPALPEPQTLEELEARARWEERQLQLEYYASRLPATPDSYLLMPVAEVRVRQVADTWGAPRGGGRLHEGQDIFAPRGTPIYAAADGFVWRMGYGRLGGNYLFVVGAGGRRYYYAHLEAYAEGLNVGDYVTRETVIGFVGNTGNALATPPHLHFGIYAGSRRTCDYAVINPLPLLKDR
jgi:peptidoglycan LD-endopeptidase LytH